MVESGQFVMQYFRSDIQVFEKEDGGIVTSVDIKNEEFLKSKLRALIPDAGFLAEESGLVETASDWMWAIDALDGTKNFVKGIPHFCIMIALLYNDEPVMSALYQPVTKELYYAEKNKGFWLQGIKKIDYIDRLYATKSLVVVCDQWYVSQLKYICKLHYNISCVTRYFGSAGIDAVYLAQGNIDGIYMKHVSFWDIAAGMLFIKEAGGLMYAYHRSLESKYQGQFIAGHHLFFKEFDDKARQNL
jgi:myo-inositol-1(or 4)-monophosphatase